MIQERLDKFQAMSCAGEDEGGAEIVQVIIVLAFAIGLGIALFALQGLIAGQMDESGQGLTDFFGALTSNKAKAPTS